MRTYEYKYSCFSTTRKGNPVESRKPRKTGMYKTRMWGGR